MTKGRVMFVPLALVLASCVTSASRDGGMLEILSPTGEQHQRVLALGECRFRVISGTLHERYALDLERVRVGDYHAWPLGGLLGTPNIYFPVPYDGRARWEVEGVTFVSRPMMVRVEGGGQRTVHAVRSLAWDEQGLSFLFSERGDYLGMHSLSAGVLGVANPDVAERFYDRCRP